MKAGDIRDKSSEQIQEGILEAQEELMNLRFQKETGQSANSALPRELRRDIARMKTILRERELLGMP